MNLFTTVLLALSVASLGTAMPVENPGQFASSLSAGPTNVVDSYGGGIGNIPNLQFSRMKQHGDGQNPIFVDGEPIRLAGHAAPKSSSTSNESGVKTVYHNNNLGVSVPTLEEFNSRGKAQAVSLLKKQTRGKSSISPQQKSVIQQRLNALTSSDGASARSAYAHHTHAPLHHKSAQHKKGPKRLHVSKNGKSAHASRRSSSAGVPRPSSVTLNKQQERLLKSASKLVESMVKRHDGRVFEAIESVSDDGSSKTSSASSTDAPVTGHSTKSKSTTTSSQSKSTTSSKSKSTTSSKSKSTTTSSKSKSAATSAKGKMLRKCRPRKKFTSNMSVKTVTLSPSSSSSTSKTSSPTSSSSRGHGVTVSQGSSESLRYGKTISLGDDRSVDDGSDVIQKLLL